VPIPPAGDFDERAVRVTQTVLAITLLGAFVFRVPLLVPAATLAVAPSAILGPQTGPLHLAYRSLASNRVRPGANTVSSTAVRAQDALATGLLVFASLAFLAGVGALGWLFALTEAGVATMEATTGLNAATALRDRMDRD
jgi:hypothetical protein